MVENLAQMFPLSCSLFSPPTQLAEMETYVWGKRKLFWDPVDHPDIVNFVATQVAGRGRTAKIASGRF